VNETIEDIYLRAVKRSVDQALSAWNVSNPGLKPDALVVGELLRSQMGIAKSIRFKEGACFYGDIRLFFCESSGCCMGVKSTPS